MWAIPNFWTIVYIHLPSIFKKVSHPISICMKIMILFVLTLVWNGEKHFQKMCNHLPVPFLTAVARAPSQGVTIKRAAAPPFLNSRPEPELQTFNLNSWNLKPHVNLSLQTAAPWNPKSWKWKMIADILEPGLGFKLTSAPCWWCLIYFFGKYLNPALVVFRTMGTINMSVMIIGTVVKGVL